MPSEKDGRSFLEERKAAILAELRAQVPELITEYLWITKSLELADEMNPDDESEEDGNFVATSDEYASVISSSEAILRYLSEKGVAPRRVMANYIRSAGWGKGRVKNPRGTLMSMLKYYLGDPKKNRPAEAKSAPIKEVNGLVGRTEWPEADFVMTNEDGSKVYFEAKNYGKK